MLFSSAHPQHSRPPFWRRWLGFSEVWVGVELSCQLLVVLRWLAAFGQGVTLLVVWRLGVDVPWWPCATAVGVTLVTNAALAWWLRQLGGHLREGFFHILLWDALTLTFLLHWTGGAGNPFLLFYLVQLTLAGVTLRTSAVASFALLLLGCCAWLWGHGVPLRLKSGAPVGEDLLMQGRGVALALAGGLLLALLLSMRRRSHRLQKERERLRAELESRDRFLSVAALATGFAHELGTPLGTISLAAAEMQAQPDADTAAIIAREAERCQKVLQRLRELGQEATGLSAAPCAAHRVVQEALNELPPGQRARVRLSLAGEDAPVACAGLREALLVLLRNALLSSPDEEPVSLRVETSQQGLRFIVEDCGPGFTPEMLRHWGEPFRSTREPGTGLGLGLFFVRRLAAAMHGSLEAGNRPGGGARVSLVLPPHETRTLAAP